MLNSSCKYQTALGKLFLIILKICFLQAHSKKPGTVTTTFQSWLVGHCESSYLSKLMLPNSDELNLKIKQKSRNESSKLYD